MKKQADLSPLKTDYRFCRLRFFERLVGLDNDEPSKYLQSWAGHIEWDKLGEGPTQTLGVFSLSFVDLMGALTEQTTSYWDVFDTTQGTWEIYETLFDVHTGELKEAVKELAFGPNEYALTEGVLYVERVALLPPHRGYGLGLLAMKRLIEQFRALAGLVVIKVFPLQLEGSPFDEEVGGLARETLGLDAYTCTPRSAVARLKRHYARLGFVDVPGTDFMVLDPARSLPDTEKLLKRRTRASGSRNYKTA